MYVIKIEPEGLYWTGDINCAFTKDKFEAEMFVKKEYAESIVDAALILIKDIEGVSIVVEEVKTMYEFGDTCPICGEGKLEVKRNEELFTYKGYELKATLTSYVCPKCGKKFFDNNEMSAKRSEVEKFLRQVNTQTLDTEASNTERC